MGLRSHEGYVPKRGESPAVGSLPGGSVQQGSWQARAPPGPHDVSVLYTLTPRQSTVRHWIVGSPHGMQTEMSISKFNKIYGTTYYGITYPRLAHPNVTSFQAQSL